WLACSVIRLGNRQGHTSARQAMASYREARSIAQTLQPESLRAELLASASWGTGIAYKELGDVGRSCSAYVEAAKWYGVLKSSPVHAAAAAEVDKSLSLCGDANR